MEIVDGSQVLRMVRNTLNLVDDRLVDHGIRVAAMMKEMLEVKGIEEQTTKENLCILSLLHDVGAYQTEEINNLLRFETATIWQHSIYGYFFLKEFLPMGELTKVVLYHHVDYSEKWEESEEIMQYAQMLHVADRADIWIQNYKSSRVSTKNYEKQLETYFQRKSGSAFSEDAVTCFLEANKKSNMLKKLKEPIRFEEVINCNIVDEKEIKMYLWVLVHAIDFRSRVTVHHTVSTIAIACQLAKRMGLSEQEQKQMYYGALLHDLGKIGTPVAILEKPAKLTEEEMHIMRQHVVLTKQIIENCVEETTAKIALRHHEKLDGSGYPLGITGEEMTLQERILPVADIASALCMNRSYKEAFSKEHVFSILNDMREKGQIDGTVLDTLTSGYDEIMREAQEACVPIEKIYERINREYQQLLEKFKEKRRK